MFLALKYDNSNIVACSADEAVKGHGIYFCPECGEPVFLREGNVNAAHFAHEKDTTCDGGFLGQYHPMTEWHKAWQKCFPEEYREFYLKDEKTGQSHRADIKIGQTVIEFQHSPISNNNFRKRSFFWIENGYRVIWLFDFRNKTLWRYDEYKSILEDAIEPFLTFAPCDNDVIGGALSIFIECPSGRDRKRFKIWERGYDIIRLNRIYGNQEYKSASLYYDYDDPACWYDKNRFLSFCGLKENKKGHYLSEIASKYEGSQKIAAYNYETNEDVIIENDVVFKFDQGWATIYHYVSKEKEAEFKRKELEREERIREHNRKINEEQCKELLNEAEKYFEQVNVSYKKRTDLGKSSDRELDEEVFKIQRKLLVDTFDEGIAIGSFIDSYRRNMDAYYLALLRKLPDIAEQRKEDAENYQNEIIKAIENKFK